MPQFAHKTLELQRPPLLPIRRNGRLAMKLNILSDLHLGQGAMESPRNDADVVVLAGDIARPEQALDWAVSLGKPVLYVPGNHEFYGGSITGTKAQLKQLCA